MATMNMQVAEGNYDARWFIWTIVFLVVTGISLVSYIVLSDSGNNDVPVFANVQAAQNNRTQKP
jgi:hypothetical protein